MRIPKIHRVLRYPVYLQTKHCLSRCLIPKSYPKHFRRRYGWINRVYVCMYVCMYVRTYVRMYVCMYVCMYVYTPEVLTSMISISLHSTRFSMYPLVNVYITMENQWTSPFWSWMAKSTRNGHLHSELSVFNRSVPPNHPFKWDVPIYKPSSVLGVPPWLCQTPMKKCPCFPGAFAMDLPPAFTTGAARFSLKTPPCRLRWSMRRLFQAAGANLSGELGKA